MGQAQARRIYTQARRKSIPSFCLVRLRPYSHLILLKADVVRAKREISLIVKSFFFGEFFTSSLFSFAENKHCRRINLNFKLTPKAESKYHEFRRRSIK